MRYQFIAQHRQEYPITLMCREARCLELVAPADIATQASGEQEGEAWLDAHVCHLAGRLLLACEPLAANDRLWTDSPVLQ